MNCLTCGHPQGEHTRDRGACLTCYGASDHGALPYCRRYRSNPNRPTAMQLDALRRMAADGDRLIRVPGYWITPSTPKGTHGWTWSWFLSTESVRSMERKGLITRARESTQEWRDPRVLTEAGREAAAQS